MRTIALFTLLSANSLFSQEPVKPDSVQTIHLKKELQAEDRIIDMCEDEASFPGGMSALSGWIAMNFKYPAEAIDMGLQGKVYVGFIIERDGSISDVRVMRGVPDCPECDKEALRLIKTMPSWDAGTVAGKAVRTRMMIPIIFRLQ